MRLRWPSILGLVSILPLGAAEPASGGSVAATVNDRVITSAELDRAMRPQLAEIEERVRQLRESTLKKLIDNTLIEQAAREEGTSSDEFLKRHVESVEVTAASVEDAYARSREQFPGILPAEAKYRIKRTLEDNARAAALQGLLNRLRQNARITNSLATNVTAALSAAGHEGPSLGDTAAPITILEFSDFECAYCQAAQKPLDKILKRWPGKVRVVFKHFPLDQHTNAMSAARAGVCAERQGRFWELHDELFEAGQPLTEAVIGTSAGRAGLALQQFNACLSSEEPMDLVRKDVMLGRMAGVRGTPAFFVNGQPVGGIVELESAVESLLGDSK